MTLHLMKNFLSCTLSALFSLTVISAQDLGPVALLEIDFWINGINTIEDRTIKTFEKTAEREELIYFYQHKTDREGNGEETAGNERFPPRFSPCSP